MMGVKSSNNLQFARPHHEKQVHKDFIKAEKSQHKSIQKLERF
jgi:hypothetical protein